MAARWILRIVQLVRLLAHPEPFGYDSPTMLSRAQEARVRVFLWSSPAGTVQTYCLEHLATAATIPPGHMADLAVFVRTLHERGDCQRRFGGFCDAIDPRLGTTDTASGAGLTG